MKATINRELLKNSLHLYTIYRLVHALSYAYLVDL